MSRANLTALERAAAAGIELVPTTGRFFGAMPTSIRELPFLHYAITINGAAVDVAMVQMVAVTLFGNDDAAPLRRNAVVRLPLKHIALAVATHDDGLCGGAAFT